MTVDREESSQNGEQRLAFCCAARLFSFGWQDDVLLDLAMLLVCGTRLADNPISGISHYALQCYRRPK